MEEKFWEDFEVPKLKQMEEILGGVKKWHKENRNFTRQLDKHQKSYDELIEKSR